MKENHKPSRFTRKIITALRKLNIYPRLVLIFCCLLILSTGFITFFNQTGYARELESNTVKYQSVLVQNAMYKLHQEQENVERNVAEFILNEKVRGAFLENNLLLGRAGPFGYQEYKRTQENRKTIEHAMQTLRNKIGGLRAVVFVGVEGSQYSSANMKNDPKSPIVRNVEAFWESELAKGAAQAKGYPDWRDSVRETPQLFFENPKDKIGIVGCVTVSYQIYSTEFRQELGTLVCCIEPRYFVDALREYSSQNGGNTFLIGSGGLLEGIQPGLDAPPFPTGNRELKEKLFASYQNSFPFENDGKELLVGFCGDEYSPLRVVNLTYRDRALLPATRLGEMNLLVLLIVILVGSFGFYITAVSVAYPVRRLIRTMKRVGTGDFNATYKAKSRDEIGVLCREFDRMVLDMRELIEKVYVAENREKELELAEKSAQLDALQMQVNPHFLYNTLDMIRWQCMYENGGESPASDMIEKFCTLLRMTIKGEKKEETVSESLLHASTYLEVVNFRHTHKIELEKELQFDPDAYQLPCLSLQPVLENAIRHGFQNKNRENCVICIQGVQNSEGDLEISVTDNGCGMDPQQLEKLKESLNGPKPDQADRHGIGLRNVHQRCKICYGEKYGIRIESEEEVGTRVILKIPARPVQKSEGLKRV